MSTVVESPAIAPASFLSITLNLEELFKVSRDQTVRQVLNDLLVTAIEGGSTYWANDCLLDPEHQATTGSPWYANAFDLGLRMKVSEHGGDDYDLPEDMPWHALDLSIAVEGLRQLAAKHPRHFFAIVEAQDDAETADAWLQLAVLGELRYG